MPDATPRTEGAAAGICGAAQLRQRGKANHSLPLDDGFEPEPADSGARELQRSQTMKGGKANRLASIREPGIPPRQFFPGLEAPSMYPPLPKISSVSDVRYRNAVLKNPDDGYCFGSSVGLLVDHGTRFVRAMSFCRRQRRHEVRGHGRMLRITFSRPRPPRPFAIGNQCHFGLGLFVPANG